MVIENSKKEKFDRKVYESSFIRERWLRILLASKDIIKNMKIDIEKY